MKSNYRILCAALLLAAPALAEIASSGLSGGETGYAPADRYSNRAGIELAPGVHLRIAADGAMTYDDNIWLVTDRPVVDVPVRAQQRTVEKDTFYTARLMLTLSAQSYSVRSQTEIWGAINRYTDTGARDWDELGARTQIGFGIRDTLAVNLYGRYASVDEYDFGPIGWDYTDPTVGIPALVDPTLHDRTSVNTRKLADVGIQLSRDLTEKTSVDVRGSIANVNYDNARVTDEAYVREQDRVWRLNDTLTYRLAGEATWKATDKTSAFVTADGEIQDSDAYADPATQLALRVGASSATTEKIRIRAAIGVMQYDYQRFPNDPNPGEPGYMSSEQERGAAQSESSTKLSFETGAQWRPTDRWNLQASAYTAFQPSVQYAGNAVFYQGLQLGAGYQLTRKLHVGATAGVRRDEYLEPVQAAVPNTVNSRHVLPDKYADLTTLSARLTYRPPDSFWAAYVEARKNTANSNDPDAEYDALQITLGVSVWR